MSRRCKFGRAVGEVMQVAYVVDDLETAAMEWVRRLNIGPWLVMDHFLGVNMKYYGEPTDVGLSLAIAFSGSMSFELIAQKDRAPSVYLDAVKAHGYGCFHHWAVTTDEFDTDIERHIRDGSRIAFSGEVAPVGRKRFAYIDTNGRLPGMIELIELNEAVEDLFAGIKTHADGWTGANPIRRL